MLARIMAQTDVLQAEELLEGFDEGDVLIDPAIDSIHTLIRLVHRAESGESMPDEPEKEDYLQAARAVRTAEWDDALRGFIEVIQKNRYYDDDGARRACLAIFNILGASHELTRKHRRQFDMALY